MSTFGEDNSEQAENTAPDAGAGALHIFTRNDAVWGQESSVEASNSDGFGFSVGLSADGSTLAVGASSEEASATGIDSMQENNIVLGAGLVSLYQDT